jgi:hypothetical protein
MESLQRERERERESMSEEHDGTEKEAAAAAAALRASKPASPPSGRNCILPYPLYQSNNALTVCACVCVCVSLSLSFSMCLREEKKWSTNPSFLWCLFLSAIWYKFSPLESASWWCVLKAARWARVWHRNLEIWGLLVCFSVVPRAGRQAGRQAALLPLLLLLPYHSLQAPSNSRQSAMVTDPDI